MELHQLRYFIAVAESGSMTVAARRCHVAQPSLSAQVRKLEESVGVRLFDRHGRGAALTQAGALLLPRAKRILDETIEIEMGLRANAESGMGTLAVGAIPTIAPYLLPAAITHTQTDFPACSIRMCEDYTEKLIELLIDNLLDVAVLSLPIEHELIEVEAIGEEPFVVAVPASHPLARSKKIGLNELRTLPKIVLNETNCFGQQVSAYCTVRRIDAGVVCEAAQLITVLEMVRRGVGLALVPELAASAQHVGGVVFKPVAKNDARRQLVLARRVDRTRSILSERFAAHVTDGFRDIMADRSKKRG